ncbi:MAG: hypothetical protein KC422_07050 [Trueperaceae bacterium]|nr:hypothetical protein [Trueperaceae bacterium]
MSPEILQLFFRLGMFVTLTALFLVFAVPKGSAEFVISVLSLAIGVVLLGLVLLLSFFSRK